MDKLKPRKCRDCRHINIVHEGAKLRYDNKEIITGVGLCTAYHDSDKFYLMVDKPRYKPEHEICPVMHGWVPE